MRDPAPEPQFPKWNHELISWSKCHPVALSDVPKICDGEIKGIRLLIPPLSGAVRCACIVADGVTSGLVAEVFGEPNPQGLFQPSILKDRRERSASAVRE